MVKSGNRLRRALRGPLTAAVAIGMGVALLAGLGATPAAADDPVANAKKTPGVRCAEHHAVEGLPDRLSIRVWPEPLLLGGGVPGLKRRGTEVRVHLQALRRQFPIRRPRSSRCRTRSPRASTVTCSRRRRLRPHCSMWKRHLEPARRAHRLARSADVRRRRLFRGTGGDGHHAAPSLHTTRTSITRLHHCHGALQGGGGRRFRRLRPRSASGRRPSSRAQRSSPNAEIVVDQPANFDPRVALEKIQNALLAHPDITVISLVLGRHVAGRRAGDRGRRQEARARISGSTPSARPRTGSPR